MKKLFLLIFLFFSFNSLVYAEEVYLTLRSVSVGYEACMPAVGTTVTRSYLQQSKPCGGGLETRRGVPLYKLGGRTIASFFVAKPCPDGYERDSSGGCKPKNNCSSKKGNPFGIVRFPLGTSKVQSICRSSCSAEVTAWVSKGIEGDPQPFGHYQYSGEECTGGGDGSGSGGDGSGSGGDGSGSGGDGSGSGGDGSGSGGDGSGSGGDGSGSGGDGSGSGGDGSGSGGDGSGSGGDGSGSGGDGSGSGGDGSGSGGDGSGSGGDGSGSGGDGSGSGGDGSNVVSAVKDMHRDVVNNLDNLSTDINNNGSGIKTGLSDNTAAVNSNGDKISNDLKKGFSDIGNSLGDLKGSVDGVKGSLDGIEDTLNDFANVDTSGAGANGTCIKSSTCKSFYDSNYPEGISGVVGNHLKSIKANTLDGFVDTFSKLDLSNASRPKFVMPILNFGNFNIEDYINLDWIFGFVRFCLIFTAIATARKNIFGG